MRFADAAIMTAVSLGADATSNPIRMEQEMWLSIQAVWTGSPAGNFTVETSNDDGVINPLTGLAVASSIANWTTYTGSSQAAGGAAGDFVWRLIGVPDKWVRLKYTRTSGTGSVTARFMAKGF